MDIRVQIMLAVIKAILSQGVEYLTPETLAAIKAAAGYNGIRIVMRGAIFGSIFGYLSGGSWSDARDRMITAVARTYTEATDLAYVEGGGELPIDEETAAWARSQIDSTPPAISPKPNNPLNWR